MKHEIDRLIANILLDEGEVYLPDVGTLILVRHGATLLSSKELQSPYRELRFTGERRGVSLVEHLCRTAELTEERAKDIYAEYLVRSQRDGVTTIEGVCTIADRRMQTDPLFESRVNPKGRGVVRVRPRTNHLIYLAVVLCILLGFGVAGYRLYVDGVVERGDITFVRRAVERAIDSFVAPAEEAEKTEEAEAQPISAAEPIAEPAKEVSETATAQAAAQSAEQSVEPQSYPPLKRGYSYAVWGVYNEVENADEAMAWLDKRFPQLEARIYAYGDRYMLAVYELSSRSACGRKVSAMKSRYRSFRSVWVYTHGR